MNDQHQSAMAHKTRDGSIVRIALTSIERAILETSPHICGDFKQAWTMTLLRRRTKCRLPRGFAKGKKPFYVRGSL